LTEWRKKTGDPLLNPATLTQWREIPLHPDKPSGTYMGGKQ
jgi:hypothetical protein